ncbi:MAG TPA: HAD family hydrolase [Verrucomicrobiae bacterium]
MIDAIIFDLDSCISAADEPGQQLFAPAFAAIRAANRGSHSESELTQALADMWRLPFDFVAEKYAFTQPMKDAGWHAFLNVEVTTPMRGYGDLDVLGELKVRRFLVTSGFRRLQESKIRVLNIAPLFTQIVVDALNEPNSRGKLAIIQDLIRTHHLVPSRTLIVGDNPDSELAAGLRLGIRTVQTLRPGVPRYLEATHHISTFHELRSLLASVKTPGAPC